MKVTSITLDEDSSYWLDQKGRDFNFSEWVRDKIKAEIEAEDAAVGKHISNMLGSSTTGK